MSMEARVRHGLVSVCSKVVEYFGGADSGSCLFFD